MTHLYNCRHDGDQYRITKFDSDLNVESSYLTTLTECDCPAAARDTCRHRQMLPKFIQREAVGTEWFYDFDRSGWVHGLGHAEPSGHHFEYTEETCPNHVAWIKDPKICGNCGVHIDSLRPDEDIMPDEYPQQAIEAEASAKASRIDRRGR